MTLTTTFGLPGSFCFNTLASARPPIVTLLPGL
jgi:hypothetical protein